MKVTITEYFLSGSRGRAQVSCVEAGDLLAVPELGSTERAGFGFLRWFELIVNLEDDRQGEVISKEQMR